MAQHAEWHRYVWNEPMTPESFASITHITETICSPFAIRQFREIGLLPPVDSHPRVLDNACGSGRQTEILHDAYKDAKKPIEITCCDINEKMIERVQSRIYEGNWTNVKAHVIDAEVVAD